jgi:hypothetical protein
LTEAKSLHGINYGQVKDELQNLLIREVIRFDDAKESRAVILEYYPDHMTEEEIATAQCVDDMSRDELITMGTLIRPDDTRNLKRSNFELCKIRCNGPLIVFQSGSCWEQWREGESFFNGDLANGMTDGYIMPFAELEKRGAIRCPLRSASSSTGPSGTGQDPLWVNVDVTEEVTIDGVRTSTIRHIRTTIAPETEVLHDAHGRPTATLTAKITPMRPQPTDRSRFRSGSSDEKQYIQPIT